MLVRTRILKSLYRDSVALMRLSAQLNSVEGVSEASAVMATGGNLDLLRESHLLEGETGAGPNDLLVVVRGEDEAALEAALDHAESMLNPQSAASARTREEMAPRSIEMAMGRLPGANLALISTPGEYAAAEAFKALRLGLNVMCFSDNVTESDEVALKRYAAEHGLLMMGPDCGTAILNGVPLGFANHVRRGGIGLVAASGTGLQQVTCLIDRFGEGVSHAIGTGGRDLHAEVDGLCMRQGLRMLAADPKTRVIVIISKPPAPEVAKGLLAEAAGTNKPVVVNFLGMDAAQIRQPNLHPAPTLEDAARIAVALASGKESTHTQPRDKPLDPPAFTKDQRAVRGLFSGGTFCYEALLLLSEKLGTVYSNTPVNKSLGLKDVWRSQGHTVVDLGDDRFTRGRPHPMIDHRLRNERMAQEASDGETAVILLDVVLGTGSHADPAVEMIPAIAEAKSVASKAGRTLVFVASVCGTERDPQGLARQEAALAEAGVILAPSNAQAARLTTRLVEGR
jgi:succinyl-CoA synthetase alpha subunit